MAPNDVAMCRYDVDATIKQDDMGVFPHRLSVIAAVDPIDGCAIHPPMNGTVKDKNR